MEYIHIRNLEKFHPGYKDRKLLWGKIFINMADGDPDTEMIEDEIDWCRYVKMILLELRAQKPLPNTPTYWTRKGFNLKKRSMSLTIQMLQEFIEIVTDMEKNGTEVLRREDKIREEKIREEKSNTTMGNSPKAEEVFEEWNKTVTTLPTKILNKTRRDKINLRLKEQAFLEGYPKIFQMVEQSDFLTGRAPSKEHPNFKGGLDWIITNDHNYIKVLEGKYNNKHVSEIERFLK